MENEEKQITNIKKWLNEQPSRFQDVNKEYRMFNDFWKLIISKLELSVNNLNNLKIEHQKLVLEDIKITEELQKGKWVRDKKKFKYLQKQFQIKIKEKQIIIITLEKIIKRPEILIDIMDNSYLEIFKALKQNNIFFQSVLINMDMLNKDSKERENNSVIEEIITEANNLQIQPSTSKGTAQLKK